MTADDWKFVKALAAKNHVTLKDAGANRDQTLGFAIDSVLAASERRTS